MRTGALRSHQCHEKGRSKTPSVLLLLLVLVLERSGHVGAINWPATESSCRIKMNSNLVFYAQSPLRLYQPNIKMN